MSDDPYRRIARLYDRVFEPMNRGLRVLGYRLFQPPPGGSILDVGCGTGMHLELYRRVGCSLYGLDASPSMLERAQSRLGGGSDLRVADATSMPYETGSFELVLSMLVLHEMEAATRGQALEEMKRVVKRSGRILLIDFHPGKPRPFRGWLFKAIILLSEVAAGRRHFRCYRHFMASGGLPALIEGSNLAVELERIVGEGNMALYLLRTP